MFSLGTPAGLRATTCGYCSPAGERSYYNSSHQIAGLSAIRLSCDVYQKMIDRGWRRSGKWCYKPHLETSCCPQYTIKLDALEFRLSHSHRKLINKWNRFIIYGSDAQRQSSKKSPKHNPPFILSEALHSSESSSLGGSIREHEFEVTLEPSSFTPEKFELYCKYQRDIHSDTDNTAYGFRRFLVDSPLQHESIPYAKPRPAHLPEHYGSYHQLYRVDGKLIAVSVLDILPSCVSSVYFMYDKEWEKFSLGKLSVLRECSLAREIHECGVPDLKFLYLGFYIHTCQKMKYKAEYEPSYLADPETYEWFPMSRCRPLLDTNRYACFSSPEHSLPMSSTVSEDEFLSKGVPEIDNDWLGDINVVTQIRDGIAYVNAAKNTEHWDIMESREEIVWCAHGLGRELASEVVMRC